MGMHCRTYDYTNQQIFGWVIKDFKALFNNSC